MADLICYRGEQARYWPEPSKRLIYGLTAYSPWQCKTISDIWTNLIRDLKKIPKKRTFQESLDAYAQSLRGSGQAHVIASARTVAGAYSYEYYYTITISNYRTFLIQENYTLGKEVQFLNAASITNHYIVLNAGSIAGSEILAFGHKTGTREVTFMHGLHPQFISSCTYNGKGVNHVCSLSDITFEERSGTYRAAYVKNPLETRVGTSPLKPPPVPTVKSYKTIGTSPPLKPPVPTIKSYKTT